MPDPVPSPVTVDFALLPPKLQMKLWVLGLDADTSTVGIVYKSGAFKTSLDYSYGGAISAHYVTPRLNLSAGVDPGSGAMTTGLVYRGFRFGTSADFSKSTFGGSIGYGAGLLPFPDQLATTFNNANGGLMSMTRDIQAAPNNPLQWFKMHSNDIATTTAAVSQIKSIAESKKGEDSFGAQLRISHDPASGLTIFLGAGMQF